MTICEVCAWVKKEARNMILAPRYMIFCSLLNSDTRNLPPNMNIKNTTEEIMNASLCPVLPYTRDRSGLFAPRFWPTRAEAATESPSPNENDRDRMFMHIRWVEYDVVPIWLLWQHRQRTDSHEGLFDKALEPTFRIGLITFLLKVQMDLW